MAKRVVIIGGGFGGIAVARGLASSNLDVVIVDRRNHHLFQPLLYQVATAGLAPTDIAEPIRSITRKLVNVRVKLAEVTAIDLEERTLQLVTPDGSMEELPYDHLVVAAGVQSHWFGNDWERFAPGLKTIGDALEIRRRVLLAFEKAEWATPEEREALLTFVVVGGGPTGVELAGAISEIACHTLAGDFRQIDTSKAKIVLLEGGPGILSTYPEKLAAKGQAQLESLGVTVRTGALVESCDDSGVTLKGGEHIAASTILWGAGVGGGPLGKQLGVELDRAGRVIVSPDTSLPGHPEVFVIGDLAHHEHDGVLAPGVAPAATQMGEHVARLLTKQIPMGTPFQYWDKGSMATIGRSRAVLHVGRIQLGGILAWLGWVFIHLLFLVTFRNRLLVLVKWAWAWVSYERASRLLWQGERG